MTHPEVGFFNVTEAFSDMLEDIIILNPDGEGTYIKGQFVDAPKTRTEVKAVVQHMNLGEVIKVLPEADREEKHLRVFTEAEVNFNAFIRYRGIFYEVINVEDWQVDGGYFEAIVQRTDGIVNESEELIQNGVLLVHNGIQLIHTGEF